MKVTIFHNTASWGDKFDGYKCGHQLKRVFSYDYYDALNLDTEAELERAFRIGNGEGLRDANERESSRAYYYDAHLRSVSVGDVVSIGDMSYACQPVGWTSIADDFGRPRYSRPGAA